MAGQELVHGCVQQAHGHGSVADDPQQVAEVLALRVGQRGQCAGLGLGVMGQDHPPDQRQPLAEELVLGAAQADAVRAEPDRDRGVRGGVRIGAYAEPANVVGPLQHRA